jgi:hypothetical protein
MSVDALSKVQEAVRLLYKRGEEMKLVKMSVATAMVCLMTTSTIGAEKRQLKGNMMEVYNTLPASVDTIGEAFSQGVFYGRLRMNTFKWDWKSADTATNKDNQAVGMGASLIYKTAPISGFSATVGLYYADNPIPSLRDDNADVGAVKAGKDTFSRKRVKDSGTWSMASVAQAYLQYDFSKTSLIAGRQIFESVLTNSNDTKMIPNTFEGVSVTTKELPQTVIRAGYFTKQKLRDHDEFHDVLTFKDSSGDSWGNNDDAGVHKGLSYANFKTAGKETAQALIVADVRNTSVENLQVDVTYVAVPDVVSSVIGELNYKIALPAGYSLTPGVRYMQQMDDGGGVIGGASLSGTVNATNASAMGYKTGDSLDSSLMMGRLLLEKGPLKFQVAYSAVGDEGDIVAPWRGFPTGGYTRAMAQYNWRANTKTTAVEAKYDFGKANLISGFTMMVRYAMQDFDEAKQAGGVQADSDVLHIDLIQQITPALQAKVRVGIVSAEERVAGGDKDSYNEYRFELNYLF